MNERTPNPYFLSPERLSLFSAMLLEAMGIMLIDRTYFQNYGISERLLLSIVNNFIRLLILELKAKAYTNNMYQKGMILLGEFFNDMSTFFFGESLHTSITALLEKNLWSHLPAIVGYPSLRFMGSQLMPLIVEKVLRYSGLTKAQKKILAPLLNTLGNLALEFVPKAHANDKGAHYQYPSIVGYSQTYTENRIITLKGDKVTLQQQGTLETPEGDFEGQAEINFKLRPIQMPTEGKIKFQVPSLEGKKIPVEFQVKQNQLGREIIVNSPDKELAAHWRSYFPSHVESKKLTLVETTIGTTASLTTNTKIIHPTKIPTQQDFSQHSALTLGLATSIVTQHPLPALIATLNYLPKALAIKEKPKNVPSKYYAHYFRHTPVSEIPIEIDLGTSVSMSNLISEEMRSAKKLQEKLKDILPNLMHPEVLERLKQTTLKVVVTSRDYLAKNADLPQNFKISENTLLGGAYLSQRNIILICNELVYMEDWTLKRILLNEFHHAVIANKNFLFVEKNIVWGGVNGDDMLLSFLNADIEIDFTKKRRFERATEEFKSNIKKFIAIHDKQERKETLTSAETSFLDKATHLIKEYYAATPYRRMTVPSSFYDAAKKNRQVRNYPDSSVWMHKNLFNRPTADLHVRFFKELDGIKVGFYAFAQPGNKQSRVVAFIYDMKDLLERYATKETPTGDVYARKSPNLQLAEFSSDIEMLPSELKLFLAPLWCKAFSKYHEVDQYCYTPPTDNAVQAKLEPRTKSFEGIPQEKALSNGFIPLNNSYSENGVCSAFENPDFTKSSQENTVISPKAPIPSPLEKTKNEERKTPNSHYFDRFFKPIPGDDIPVEIDLDRFLTEMPAASSENKHDELSAANTLAQKIRNILPKLPINPELFATLKQTNLKITIVSKIPENFAGDAWDPMSSKATFVWGYYLTYSNNIFIPYQISYLSERNLKFILLNKLYHALIAVRNFLYVQKNIPVKQNNPSADTALFPFLNKDAEIDERLLRRLTRAYEEFWNNVNKFIELYKKKENGETLSSDEHLWFDKAAHLIIVHYSISPCKFFHMEKKLYQDAKRLRYIQNYPDGSARIDKRVVEEGGFKHDVHGYVFEKSDELVGMVYTFEHPNEPESRIYAFIEDMEDLKTTYEGGESYGKKKPTLKAARFSSEIEPIDSPIKQFFSPIWCKAHKEYHKVNKIRGAYCYTPPTDGEETNEERKLMPR